MGGGVTVGMVGGCAVTAAVPGRVDSWLRRRMSAAWSWSRSSLILPTNPLPPTLSTTVRYHVGCDRRAQQPCQATMTLGLRRLDRTKIRHILAGCRRLRWLCHSLVRAAVRLPKSVVVIGYRSPAPAASARRCHEKLCVAVISVDIGVKGLCPRIYVPPCVPALIWNVNSWSQMRMWSPSFSVTAERIRSCCTCTPLDDRRSLMT